MLFDRARDINVTYFFIPLDQVDCLSDKTEYNSIGNRMDFVESLFRRGAAGIRLEEIEVV